MAGPCAVCSSPADHICSGCRIINYCNRDHQKQHWKTHKGTCMPLFRIENNEQLGRHLVATRSITQGELILQEAPLVIGPKCYSQPICLGCQEQCNPAQYHECDGCGYPLCSVQCQVSDTHFDECQLMMNKKYRAKIDFVDPSQKDMAYFPIVPLRCLLLKSKQPEKYKKMMDLQSHLKERLGTALYTLYKANVSQFIRERLGLKEFEEDVILNISGILDTNGFEIRNKKSKFRGLYLTSSMIAHDCRPNTRHTFHGKEFVIAVSATRDIAKGDVITATYTQTFWSTPMRREHLRLGKYFDCICDRCTDPSEFGTFIGAIRCTRCVTADNFQNGPYIVSSNPLDNTAPWNCLKCGHAVAAKLIRSGNDDLRNEIVRIDKSSCEGLEEFLDKYGSYSAGVLHPRNTHVVQVKHALVQMYGNSSRYQYSELTDEQLEKKLDYCHELLELVDTLDSGHSRIRGQLLNELQATMAVQAKRQFNADKITKEAAQKTLTDAMVILTEVIQILSIEPEIEDIKQQLEVLSQQLDI